MRHTFGEPVGSFTFTTYLAAAPAHPVMNFKGKH